MKINFREACVDLFQSGKGWMNLLLLSVCMLIPLVGPVVAIGFILRRFGRRLSGQPDEDFDFGCFVEYLKMGLWPFLASLVASLVLVPLVLLVNLPTVLLISFVINQYPDNVLLIALVFIVGSVFYMLTLLLIMLVNLPIQLSAGLAMDFAAGFRKDFILSYVRKVGVSLLGWCLLLTLISIPLVFVGYLALLVGAYVVMTWLQYVSWHLTFQHYQLYLHRGGTTLPIHPTLVNPILPAPAPAPGGPA